ncbi:MAG TPA: alpha/beta hydrolase [Bryobacteraceae bacterium]|jgi:pimeloyl-ACP methyl ester carboxylesterase|nr:alpha/beta hydrolase [Bryobacteraceae bacterium]
MATAKWKTAAMAIAIAGAGVFALVLVSGLVYEQAQRVHDRERYPPVGRLIDIGGRMLDIDCEGAGQPAVVLAAGANWAGGPAIRDPKRMYANGGPRPGYSWVSIQRALAAVTTVCWYDRAGAGWSDPGPYPRDSASQARDLHALLRAARVPPPYVLAGESSAVLDARVYAGAYPAEVAGLVLVNSADPGLFLNPLSGNGKRAAKVPQFVYRSQDAMARLFSGVGLYRLGPAPPAPAPPKGLTAEEWNTIWFLTHSSKAMSALMEDIASWRLSSGEARAAGSLGGRPLLVLSASNVAAPLEWIRAWTGAQSDLAHLSTRGKQIVIGADAGDLLYDAPDAVIDAVRQVVGEVRRRND